MAEVFLYFSPLYSLPYFIYYYYQLYLHPVQFLGCLGQWRFRQADPRVPFPNTIVKRFRHRRYWGGNPLGK